MNAHTISMHLLHAIYLEFKLLVIFLLLNLSSLSTQIVSVGIITGSYLLP